ncbi:MAG: hypothetical protein KME15_11330 [Drouetiella hepatica Uher 2000/2452]|jgi:Trp operon repressor|uniref:Uncharacterized protein n=1 Tax=Drouetiella hepatica Uher 2000/2452 TaxID=904376 RepID=A0A951QCA5_9CYAN|nr:hypothetical protein [Drouetiella hepatica Uher 2000/2452]
MTQNDSNQDVQRLSIPLTPEERESLRKLAQIEERSEGKTAQRLIREALDRARAEGKI